MSILLTGAKVNGTTIIIAEQLPHNMPSTGYCTWYNCTRVSEHDGFCFHHKQYSNVPVAAKIKNEIPKVSERRKRDKKEYLKIVSKMLSESELCEIKEDGCQILATGLHHQIKRSPATYLDKSILIRACSNCNLWVEINPVEAIAKGHSFSKF